MAEGTARMIAPIDEDATHEAADEEMGMAEDSAQMMEQEQKLATTTTTTGGSTVFDAIRSRSRATT